MRVVPTGRNLVHDGNQIGRYGRIVDTDELVFIHYHSGIGGECLWAMDTAVEWKISVSVDRIFVVSADNGLHTVDRDVFSDRVRTLDGREQCLISDEHGAVTKLTDDPSDCLNGCLWITNSTAHDGYHKDKNHA